MSANLYDHVFVNFVNGTGMQMQPATIFFWGGVENKFGVSCLNYYAYRKMIALKMVFVRFWGDK